MRLIVMLFCACFILFANDFDGDASDSWGSPMEEEDTNICKHQVKYTK